MCPPDDLFRAADRQAKRSQKSRRQPYAEALAEYLAHHAPEEVTELNIDHGTIRMEREHLAIRRIGTDQIMAWAAVGFPWRQRFVGAKF